MDYPEFGKIARLNRNCTITEKIDGTSGLVAIVPVPQMDSFVEYQAERDKSLCPAWIMEVVDTETGISTFTEFMLRAGSRTRWITPDDDNHGFAKWVQAHAEELRQLGPGLHYGEWWGSGIQRGYGLPKGEKRFSLFNVGRWREHDKWGGIIDERDPAPACCSVVPILYQGLFRTDLVDEQLDRLVRYGSMASGGFMRPEGVIVWHEAARCYFKATLEKDEEPKTKFKPAKQPGPTLRAKGQLCPQDWSSTSDEAFDNPHHGHGPEEA